MIRTMTDCGRTLAWVAMGCVLMLAAWPAAEAGAGEERVVDGIPHVVNPGQPPEGRETLHLEEIWRVGGEDDEENVFGVIVQAITDDDGNTYLLDMQLSQVFVFSPDGELIKTLSREGEGPGEVRRPVDMLFLPDGNVGLLQMFPGKIIKVDREGLPAGQIAIGGNDPTQGGFTGAIDVDCRAGNLVLAGVYVSRTQSGQTRTNFLASFAEDGAEQTRYWSNETTLDFTNFKIIEADQYNVWPRRWAVGAEGEIYAAPNREQYVIEVHARSGELLRVIEREFTNRPRTDAERAQTRATLEGQTRRFPGEVHMEIADTEPTIGRIEVAPDGSIWVLHSSSYVNQPDGIMSTYDVFDPQGHLAQQVAVAIEGNGSDDGFLFAGEDRFIHVRGMVSAMRALVGGAAAEEAEEPAPMEVICYRRSIGG